MKNKKTLLSVMTCLAVGIGASTASAQTIGTTVSADQTVTGSRSGVLAANKGIQANERIRANSTGLGHFQFNDGTKMVVGPGTSLVLDETIFNPNGSTFKRFALDTSAGALRFISGDSASSNYEIKTPAGTLGLRGTAFDIQHFRGRTYIMLVSGRVQFCGNGGECQTISRKCDFVVANADGSVSAPTQPRNGIFGSGDMGRFFPFIANQSNIEPGFRLRVNTCGGGSSDGTTGGSGNGSDGSPAPSGNGDGDIG